MQHEHHAAAHHVAKRTVGLHPVPGHTQFFGQVPAAGGGVCGDEVADEDEVVVGDGAVAVAQWLGHAPQSIANRTRTQAKKTDWTKNPTPSAKKLQFGRLTGRTQNNRSSKMKTLDIQSRGIA